MTDHEVGNSWLPLSEGAPTGPPGTATVFLWFPTPPGFSITIPTSVIFPVFQKVNLEGQRWGQRFGSSEESSEKLEKCIRDVCQR